MRTVNAQLNAHPVTICLSILSQEADYMADYNYDAEDVDADEEGFERVRFCRSDGDSDHAWLCAFVDCNTRS